MLRVSTFLAALFSVRVAADCDAAGSDGGCMVDNSSAEEEGTILEVSMLQRQMQKRAQLNCPCFAENMCNGDRCSWDKVGFCKTTGYMDKNQKWWESACEEVAKFVPSIPAQLDSLKAFVGVLPKDFQALALSQIDEFKKKASEAKMLQHKVCVIACDDTIFQEDLCPISKAAFPDLPTGLASLKTYITYLPEAFQAIALDQLKTVEDSYIPKADKVNQMLCSSDSGKKEKEDEGEVVGAEAEGMSQDEEEAFEEEGLARPN